MAVLVNSGRASLVAVLIQLPLYLAWGEGNPDWDDTPMPESLSAVGLTAELGRVSKTMAAFAVADELGLIVTPTGRYTITQTPTNLLYVRFDFGFADAADKVIREVGMFVNCIPLPGLPAGQLYFTPAELASAGTLMALEHIAPVIRSPLTRQQFEFVLKL